MDDIVSLNVTLQLTGDFYVGKKGIAHIYLHVPSSSRGNLRKVLESTHGLNTLREMDGTSAVHLCL